MDSELKNNAAWFGGAKGEALKVGPGPDQSDCSADEVIIKVAYVAINPSEWKVIVSYNGAFGDLADQFLRSRSTNTCHKHCLTSLEATWQARLSRSANK